MPQVIVMITPEAQVKVAAAGVAGSSCKELTRAIEQAIGSQVADQATPEMFQQAGVKSGQQAGAGK